MKVNGKRGIPLNLLITAPDNFFIDEAGLITCESEGVYYPVSVNEMGNICLYVNGDFGVHNARKLFEMAMQHPMMKQDLFPLNKVDDRIHPSYYINRNGVFFSDETGSLKTLPITTEREGNFSYRHVRMKYTSGKEYSFDADAVYKQVQKRTNWMKDEVQPNEWLIGKRSGSTICFYDSKIYTDESVLKKEMERIAGSQPGWILCKLKVEGSVQVKLTKEVIWK